MYNSCAPCAHDQWEKKTQNNHNFLTYRSHMLQADSEETYLAWVTAMQQAIGAAIQRGMSIDANINPRESQSHDNKGPMRPLTRPKTR